MALSSHHPTNKTSHHPRRPKFSQAEIQTQLSQLHLSMYVESNRLNALTASSTHLLPPSVNLRAIVSMRAAPLAAASTSLPPLQIHRSRQQDAYLKALKVFVAEKESEIEAVCAKNYQNFVGSVSALLRVRQGTISLKHRVVELNEEVQKSGGGLAVKVCRCILKSRHGGMVAHSSLTTTSTAAQKKSLLEARRVGQNIDEAIDTLQACLRVLDMANKVQSLIENEKFFSALRQIEDLQSTQLKPVLQYPFASQMLAGIPTSRNVIRESVTRSLKAWMYEAREASRAVGKGALNAMEARGRKWNARKRKEPSLGLAKINGPIELSVSERHEYNVLDNVNVKIDFRPLYQCIHIYDSLDAREELQLSYQADRRAQAELLLSQTSSLSPFSLPALSLLLEEIVGFFLIESHVLHTTNSFRSEQDVEDLWDGMCERVVKIVDEGLANCEDPEVFLGTKLKVLTFVQTLEGYGYSVNQLNNLLLTLFERYSQLLQRKFSGDFEQIVLDDDHQSMVVNDAEEFDKVVSVSWLPASGEWSADELKTPGFPLALPFSQTYPLCCIDIRSFTEQYYQFSDGFAEQHRDIDDVLRKALDNLLIKQVSENIQRRLRMISNLSQLSQIVVNVLFFQTACQDLETLLVTLRATQRGGTIHLDSLASFDATLKMTQDRIVTNIAQKMDSFFEEANYDWLTTTTPANGAHASGYLQDLIDFVTTVMMSVLIQLPEFSKDYVYRGALSYCASVLMSWLIDREPAQISDQALMYIAKDVQWLVQHVATLGNDRLADVFQELSQTLTLVTAAPIMTDYLSVDERQTKYSRINATRLRTLLGKQLAFYNSHSGAASARRKGQVEELHRALYARS
ncbi:BZ3500_MvSof-1268-A1-R1_Chr1-2g01390 [Microbotryum saponariae]|uniref:Exocyst complex component SEC15 n=1 Tax=Microbotryum saponariae TaxID=289078 RepID=A0A2X0KEH6_9BASI|nr:BZ3500_MvSof-1268-A1-R1_Chr1-2g01390 [Microbotryum saponariae]SCZ97291.1 BZ3501_MvSof-1269-A2-R1_Chr1-2g00989 [Microbotryum saponariae]